jgi:hypothetical protein
MTHTILSDVRLAYFLLSPGQEPGLIAISGHPGSFQPA